MPHKSKQELREFIGNRIIDKYYISSSHIKHFIENPLGFALELNMFLGFNKNKATVNSIVNVLKKFKVEGMITKFHSNKLTDKIWRLFWDE